MDSQQRVSNELRCTPFSGVGAIVGLDVAVDWTVSDKSDHCCAQIIQTFSYAERNMIPVYELLVIYPPHKGGCLRDTNGVGRRRWKGHDGWQVEQCLNKMVTVYTE